jgi:hypothetical protein
MLEGDIDFFSDIRGKAYFILIPEIVIAPDNLLPPAAVIRF